jgi:hypothetical protein
VFQQDSVVFAAGSQTESVRVRTEDLFQCQQATTVPLIRQADEHAKEWPQ